MGRELAKYVVGGLGFVVVGLCYRRPQRKNDWRTKEIRVRELSRTAPFGGRNMETRIRNG